MHRDVGASLVERDLELLHEKALATDLRQGPVQDAVALGGHCDQLDGGARIAAAQRRRDHLGLGDGEAAFARGDTHEARDGHGIERVHQVGMHVAVR